VLHRALGERRHTLVALVGPHSVRAPRANPTRAIRGPVSNGSDAYAEGR
jgi:hypothetical protein